MWKFPIKLPIKKFSCSTKTIILWGLFLFYSIIIISYYYSKITEGLETIDANNMNIFNGNDEGSVLNGNTVLTANIDNGPGIVLNDIYSNTKSPIAVNSDIVGNNIASSAFNLNTDYGSISGGNLINPSVNESVNY